MSDVLISTTDELLIAQTDKCNIKLIDQGNGYFYILQEYKEIDLQYAMTFKADTMEFIREWLNGKKENELA